VQKKLLSIAVLTMSLLPPVLFGQSSYNMTEGVTEISRNVYSLHMTILYVCAAIGVLVFGVMFYAIIYHRKSKGAKAAQFHESTKVELLWTIIPFFILIAMAVPATSTLIEMEDDSNPGITIKITGSQWKWHYQYFDHDFGFFSLLSTPSDQIHNKMAKGEHYLLEVDRPLVLPVNKKISFLMTSDDVIHSWWVPAFSVKQDANPGFINGAWTKIDEPGIYRGQCAELCGKDHGFMPIVVEVLSEADYQTWLNKQLAQVKSQQLAEQQSLTATVDLEQSMKLGEQVYNSRCAACHQVGGEGIAGAFPALKDSSVALGDVKQHIAIVRDGQAGTAMQAFDKQLSLKELAAVITYERNAWGNNTGDVVQASDIASKPMAAIEIKPQVVPAANMQHEHHEHHAEQQAETIESVVEDKVTAATSEEKVDLGESVYLTRCAACHQVAGTGVPGAFPALKGSAVVLGDVKTHVDIVANGKSGTAMMGFANQLTPAELAAVITYERNAWGNNTGDVVTVTDLELTVEGTK